MYPWEVSVPHIRQIINSCIFLHVPVSEDSLRIYKDMLKKTLCVNVHAWTFPTLCFNSSSACVAFPAVLAQIPAASLPPHSAGQTLFSLLIKWKRLKGEHGSLSQRVQPENQGQVFFFPIQHNKGGTSAQEIITASTVNDSLLTKTQWVQRVQNNNDAFVEESSSRCSEYRLFHLLCLWDLLTWSFKGASSIWMTMHWITTNWIKLAILYLFYFSFLSLP